jgi:hypothetical protein
MCLIGDHGGLGIGHYSAFGLTVRQQMSKHSQWGSWIQSLLQFLLAYANASEKFDLGVTAGAWSRQGS